jgi:hypothetical protein
MTIGRAILRAREEKTVAKRSGPTYDSDSYLTQRPHTHCFSRGVL